MNIRDLKPGNLLRLRIDRYFLKERKIDKNTRGVFFEMNSIFTILEIGGFHQTDFPDILGETCEVWLYSNDIKWAEEFHEKEFDYFWEVILNE